MLADLHCSLDNLFLLVYTAIRFLFIIALNPVSIFMLADNSKNICLCYVLIFKLCKI